VLESIELAASRLARRGWTMRTGMSPGADQAFYRGALAARGRVELYLPWPAFQAHARSAREGAEVSEQAAPTDAACALAARTHPAWRALGPGARRLRARDVHEVLGVDLRSPAALVLCWTEDGSLDGTGEAAGGTGQALRVADRRGIAVMNLARPDHAAELGRWLLR
jgi:hypothetical protein